MNEADDRIHNDHGDDNAGVDVFFEQDGDDSGCQENVDQGTGELMQQDFQDAYFFLLQRACSGRIP